MSDDERIASILRAWLRGNSNDVYDPFVALIREVGVDDVLETLPPDLRSHLTSWLIDNAERIGKDAQAWVDARYRSLAQRTDPDTLHDLLASRGPSILAKDLPYIIQAARWRAYDRARRGSKESEFDSERDAFVDTDSAFEHIATDERLVALREHLAKLSNVEIRIVWWSAEGKGDSEIASELGMTTDAVRQRRHRAVVKLRSWIQKSEPLP